MTWNAQKNEYVIGIDAGTNCGIAIWDVTRKRFELLKTTMIHRAFDIVKEYHSKHRVKVRVEDARLAVHNRSGAVDRSKLQGAGSIKRDAKIWQDFLTDLDIKYDMVRPNKAFTKLTKEQFYRITKYTGSSDSHGRDAAMLVFQAA